MVPGRNGTTYHTAREMRVQRVRDLGDRGNGDGIKKLRAGDAVVPVRRDHIAPFGCPAIVLPCDAWG